MQLIAETRKFVSNARVKPMRELKTLLPQLQGLRTYLQAADGQMDKLEAVVIFFETVSFWHDRQSELRELIMEFEQSNFRGRHDEVLKNLQRLYMHFQRAGRNKHGMNRTAVGQMVTDNDVYLGNIFGLWTFTVADWKKNKEVSSNSYDAVSDQAEKFMRSHIGPMIEIINQLERLAV